MYSVYICPCEAMSGKVMSEIIRKVRICILSYLLTTLFFEISAALAEEDSLPLTPKGNCQADGLYSDPNDCSAYYYCKSGLKYHLSCGPQRLFDASNGECSFISQDRCQTGQTIFHANNAVDLSNLARGSRSPPKIVCYMSNWEFCEDELVPDQMICSKACYSFANLTTQLTVGNEDSYLPCNKTKKKRHQYKVVCYFTSWDWYREGRGRFLPKDIDPSLCTHINYAYAAVGVDFTIKSLDPWAELYPKILEYKKSGVKIILALGGWTYSGNDTFSKLVNNPEARKTFVNSVLKYFETWKFDGLELDWEYPKCWQHQCDKGPESDKSAYVDFVKEISEAFKPRGLSLSSTIGRTKDLIDSGYDIPKLDKYLDYFSILSYNYHGVWNRKTDYGSPLYSQDNVDINHTIEYILHKGASANKLVVGMKVSGRAYTLANSEVHGLGAPISGPGRAGQYSDSPEDLVFYEICENVKRKQWKIEKDDQRRTGPYAYKGDQWVSYDDVQDVETKARFIKDRKLGGALIWTLSLDDFKNVCGCGKYPLLKTINHELRGIGNDAHLNDCL